MLQTTGAYSATREDVRGLGPLGCDLASAQHLQLVVRLVAVACLLPKHVDGEQPRFLGVAQLDAATTARRILRYEEQHTGPVLNRAMMLLG